MKYIVTVTEKTPTEDGTDNNTYHKTFDYMEDVVEFIMNLHLNYTLFMSIVVTPLFWE